MFTVRYMSGMFAHFWNSDFTTQVLKKPIRNLYLKNENDSRSSQAVYAIQIKPSVNMRSAARAEALWFPLLRANSNKTMMFKNKN